MILIISTCKEKLHELEFVNPIKKIVKKNYTVRNYEKITKKDLKKADKIIICGTSLKDNEFLKNIKKFEWIKNCKKPILGICAGMEIIGLIFGGRILEKKFIGRKMENFKEIFFGFKKGEVYYLHKNIISLPKDFEKINEDLYYPTAFKHKKKKIYGVLFHPEVYNPELIKKFIS